MTDAGTPKAGQKLLLQLQRAAGGTLHVTSDQPLTGETHRLRLGMADERTLTLAHKSHPDQSLPLPLNADGYLAPYTEQLLTAIFLVHRTYPTISPSELHEIATECLVMAHQGELVVTHVVIVYI